MENWKKDECCRSRSSKMCPSSPIPSSCCNNVGSGGSVRTWMPQTNTKGNQTPEVEKTQKVLNLHERVQSLRPSGRRPRGPRRGPSPQAKGLQGHREVWSPQVTSLERSRSKFKFRIVRRKVKRTQRSGAVGWMAQSRRTRESKTFG